MFNWGVPLFRTYICYSLRLRTFTYNTPHPVSLESGGGRGRKERGWYSVEYKTGREIRLNFFSLPDTSNFSCTFQLHFSNSSKMFSKLAVVFVAAAAIVSATPTDPPAGTTITKTTTVNKCNVGTLQCCTSLFQGFFKHGRAKLMRFSMNLKASKSNLPTTQLHKSKLASSVLLSVHSTVWSVFSAAPSAPPLALALVPTGASKPCFGWVNWVA